MPGSRCTTCITFDLECTYEGPSQRRAPSKRTQVETLEARLKSLESSLRELQTPQQIAQEHTNQVADPLLSAHQHSSQSPPSINSRDYRSSNYAAGSSEEEEEEDHGILYNPMDNQPVESLSEWLQHLELDPLHNRPTLGSSAGHKLMKETIQLKRQLYGDGAHSLMRRPEFWAIDPREANIFMQSHRTMSNRHYVFPDADLIPSLIDKYFLHYNDYFPLLHRPSFEESVGNGLHLRNSGFGAVLLAVCAVGARYCDDPRVTTHGEKTQAQYAGWSWFEQLQIGTWPVLSSPRLYDIQVYALSAMYLAGSSTHGLWMIVGHGIRMALDAGVHRKTVYGKHITPQEEMWKRAFWVLISFDRTIVSELGRPCTIQDEDFDVDWPLECDDEFWGFGITQHLFQQPPDKPSKMTYVILMLKLQQIHAFALRTLFWAKASRTALGIAGSAAEQQLVIEIDSAMNKWLDSIPDHLRWDPQRQDRLFFHQAALLQASFYHLQIIIHRPYIGRKSTSLSLTSLAICTNAARANSRLLEALTVRSDGPFPWIMITAFSSALVLVLNTWSQRVAQSSNSRIPEIEDVNRCLNFLKVAESKMLIAGQFGDVVRELASCGNLSLIPREPTAIPDYDPCHGPRFDFKTRSSPSSGTQLGSLSTESSPLAHIGDETSSIISNHPWSSALDGVASTTSPLDLTSTLFPTSAAPWSSSGFTFEQMLGNVSRTPVMMPNAGVAPQTFDQTPLPEADAMEMWTQTPSGFDLENWGAYLSSMGNISSSFGGNAF